MLLAVLPFWLGHLLFLGPIHIELTENSIESARLINTKEIIRTFSEVRFIQMDYGVEFKPRKLSKREKLSLALTKTVTDSE